MTNSLSYLPRCDVIVVLKDGRLSEVGSYRELMKNNGAFSELVTQYMTENVEYKSSSELEDVPEDVKASIRRSYTFQNLLPVFLGPTHMFISKLL